MHDTPAGGGRQWGVNAALAEATTDAADSDHQPDKSEDTRDEATSAGVQAPASVWLPYKTASEKKVGKEDCPSPFYPLRWERRIKGNVV